VNTEEEEEEEEMPNKDSFLRQLCVNLSRISGWN